MKTNVVDLESYATLYLTIFSFEIIHAWKFMFEFLTFKNSKFQTISDEETIKIKFVDRKKLCYFIADIFFHLKSYMHGKSTFKFLKFKIQIFQMTLHGEKIKTKVHPLTEQVWSQ
jgi:hypothetical protein